jgi:hypothetical protein
MDRAHRIGQTKPVLVFRLVSAHTVETKVLQKASEKRKLEALVIAKGLVFLFRIGVALISVCRQVQTTRFSTDKAQGNDDRYGQRVA